VCDLVVTVEMLAVSKRVCLQQTGLEHGRVRGWVRGTQAQGARERGWVCGGVGGLGGTAPAPATKEMADLSSERHTSNFCWSLPPDSLGFKAPGVLGPWSAPVRSFRIHQTHLAVHSSGKRARSAALLFFELFRPFLALQQSRLVHTERLGWRHGSGPAACPVCGPPPASLAIWESRCMASAGFAGPQVHNHALAPPAHSLGAARLRLGRLGVGVPLLTMFAADGPCMSCSCRPVRRSRAQVRCWATIPVPDSQPVITDLGWHTDFAQHYVKVRLRRRGGGYVRQLHHSAAWPLHPAPGLSLAHAGWTLPFAVVCVCAVQGKLIGQGSFGSVYLGIDLHTGKEVRLQSEQPTPHLLQQCMWLSTHILHTARTRGLRRQASCGGC
jgi:hypothetical protein